MGWELIYDMWLIIRSSDEWWRCGYSGEGQTWIVQCKCQNGGKPLLYSGIKGILVAGISCLTRRRRNSRVRGIFFAAWKRQELTHGIRVIYMKNNAAVKCGHSTAVAYPLSGPIQVTITRFYILLTVESTQIIPHQNSGMSGYGDIPDQGRMAIG